MYFALVRTMLKTIIAIFCLVQAMEYSVYSYSIVDGDTIIHPAANCACPRVNCGSAMVGGVWPILT